MEATSGETGLEVFKEHQEEIDLILTDILMYGMDGVEFIKNVRERSPIIKVIFISGYKQKFSEHDDRQRVNFIEKSADVSQLLQKVNEVLKNKNPITNFIHKLVALL